MRVKRKNKNFSKVDHLAGLKTDKAREFLKGKRHELAMKLAAKRKELNNMSAGNYKKARQETALEGSMYNASIYRRAADLLEK